MDLNKCDDTTIKVLQDMLTCSEDCGNFDPSYKHFYAEQLIEWYLHYLPLARYVNNAKNNLIWSNNLTTGDKEADEKILNPWLYNHRNIKGVTNYSVLRQCTLEADPFGKGGARWLSKEDGIIFVKSMNYGSVLEKNIEYHGFYDTLGYIVSLYEDEKVFDVDATDREYDFNFDRDLFKTSGYLIDENSHKMFIGKDNFLNIRNDPSKENGDSVFNYDKLRIETLTTLYERMKHDLEYDGPGRLILTVKDGYGDAGDNAISTTEVYNNSAAARKERKFNAKQELEQLALQVKESKTDSVIGISNTFDPKITHLPRTTQLSDFQYFIEQEGEIISQLFGVNPVLLSLGQIYGNVSMEKIIDNSMVNDIVTEREKYATQISAWLSPKLGVEKIYFDKYEMTQTYDEMDSVTKKIDAMRTATQAGHPEVAEALAQMVLYQITDANGNYRELSAKQKSIKAIKKLFNKGE